MGLPIPAHAGQMDVVKAYNTVPPSPGAAKVGVASDGIEFTGAGDASWSYRFIDKAAPMSRIEVSVSGAPPGWESGSTEYDFPFHYERMSHLPMAVAIVNDTTTDAAIALFLSKAQTLSRTRDIADFVQVQQRARKLFRARLAEMAQNPNAPRKRDDIRIAYWLVFSTNFLINNRFARIDEVSKAAWDFMVEAKAAAEQPNAPADAKRLFVKTVPLEDVPELLRTFQNREAILLNKVLRELIAATNEDFEANRADLCPRIHDIAAQFRGMAEDVRATYNGNFANQLIATRLAARCRAAALGKGTPSEEDVKLGRQALGELADNLGSTPARSEFRSEIAFAEQQRGLLQALLR